ncbi:MAG: nucleotidyltransferase [Bryobacteraceae bacterium]
MQFEKALQALCDTGVDFVVIGGVSATFHGSARVTYDLDICYSRSPANLLQLTQALAPFHPRPRGFPAGLPFVWDEATLPNGTVFTLQTDIGEIDLLAEVTGLGDFDDVKRHSIAVEAFERRFLTLDLPGLIQPKRAAGREKDLSALAELEGLLEFGEA